MKTKAAFKAFSAVLCLLLIAGSLSACSSANTDLGRISKYNYNICDFCAGLSEDTSYTNAVSELGKTIKEKEYNNYIVNEFEKEGIVFNGKYEYTLGDYGNPDQFTLITYTPKGNYSEEQLNAAFDAIYNTYYSNWNGNYERTDVLPAYEEENETERWIYHYAGGTLYTVTFSKDYSNPSIVFSFEVIA